MIPLNKEEAHSLSRVMNIRLSLGFGINPADLNEVLNSIKTSKIDFFKNEYGIDSGYIIWCSINNYNLRRFVDFKIRPRFYSEWNEGQNTLVLQLVNKSKNPRLLLRPLLCLKRNHDKVFYFSRNNELKFFLKFDK